VEQGMGDPWKVREAVNAAVWRREIVDGDGCA